jgi:hypothetical protein
MLQAGQVIRLGAVLYRVEYVNACRARAIPLAKRHVVLKDGHEFDSEQRGVNISPDSLVEIVDDVERVRTEIELTQAEAELAGLRKMTKTAADLAQAEAELAELRKEAVSTAAATRKPTAGGWSLVPGQVARYEVGSLKAEVVGFLEKNPGADTKTVAAAMSATPGAVAACLDRFRKAGVVIKA